ncbi:putative Rna binding protein [Leptomonas seymouri]|uniref:Putative Rna binding protein n=1 Tax=Leptomonas seymouri TaxID=5684 RepID=A0A0N0P954_LEPSE|nr:putative Rna binding protein [Leptomonas seymouri]|eukprot:KPI90709.1 putative Rna binding protein [Leptomonas seymouri]
MRCYNPLTPPADSTLPVASAHTTPVKSQSEWNASSYPQISGSVAEFWTWLDDLQNFEWAVNTFPVEKGYSDRNVFVSKLPLSFTDRDLQSMFENFGEVVSAKVMLNVSTGVSKETGFVQFATAKDALRARSFLRLRPAVTEPVMPEVNTQWAQNKHDGGVYGERSQQARKLFIRNIPVGVSNDEMRALMAKFGEMAEVTLHADTYGSPAHAANSRECECSADEMDSGAAAGEASNPALSKRTTRICFVTFVHPGVAARACAAIHNTKPFRSCGGIPLMAKIAEDNIARQTRHQQASMHHSYMRAASAVATSTWGYGSRPPMRSGQRASDNTSPMVNAAWPQHTQCTNKSGIVDPMPMVAKQPQTKQSDYLQDHAPASASPLYGGMQSQGYVGNWCVNPTLPSPSSNTTCYKEDNPAAHTAVASNSSMARLTFPSRSLDSHVDVLDTAALAANRSPRPLSTTASPSMKIPNAPDMQKPDDAERRRPSLTTLTPGPPSLCVKPRTSGGVTSAPTSSRGAPVDVLGCSPPYNLGAEAARSTSPTLPGTANGKYAEQLSSTSISVLTQQQQPKEMRRIGDALQSGRSDFAAAATAAAEIAKSPVPADAMIDSWKARPHAWSSRSSDTNSFSSSCYDGVRNTVNVHVRSTSRPRRIGQTVHLQGGGAVAVIAVTPESSSTPRNLTSPAAARMSPVPLMTLDSLSVMPSPSLSHSALDESIVSSYSSFAFANSRSTPYITPTSIPSSSQTRYRNNPYGMNIVLEKTQSASFAEA